MGVILVAEDGAFRRSLRFALEAENIIVDAHDGLKTARRSRLIQEVVCAVVDEGVLDDRGASMGALQRFGKPVILLVDRPPGCADREEMAILVKPLHWDVLIQTVRDMARNASPQRPADTVPDCPDDGTENTPPPATT